MYRPITKFVSMVLLVCLAVSPLLAQKEKRFHEDSKEQLRIKVRSDLSRVSSGIEIPVAKSAARNGFAKSLDSGISIPLLSRKSSLNAAPGGELPEICGSIVFSDNDYFYKGLYRLPLAAGEDFNLLVRGVSASYGGVLKDGIYYATNHFSDGFSANTSVTGYDVRTGEVAYSWSVDEAVGPAIALGLAVDPVTEDIYGIVYREDLSGLMLAKIVYNHTPESTKIADIEGVWNTFMIDGDGQFYGIRKDYEYVDGGKYLAGSTLCRIDRSTGAVTEVGPTGQRPEYLSGGCIDPATGRMFWAVSDNTSGFMCEVDKTTGKAIRFFNFPDGEEVCGMYVASPEAADKAPGEVQNPKAVFMNGSLSGTITLTTPMTLFDGSAASGKVKVCVLANGEEIATAQADYGSLVSVPVTVPAAGFYNFTVYAENSNGKGPKSRIADAWIGRDTPVSTTVSLELVNGKMNVTWLPVTESVNGGFLESSDVSYDVVRYPDGVLVADGIKETSFSETLDEPDTQTAYTYGVTAVYEGLRSAEALSNAVSLGVIMPPYQSDFSSASGFAGFTVIDNNNDGYTWQLSPDHGFAKIRWNSVLDMDDWLITPPVQLKAGESYELSFSAYSSSLANTERLEVKWGETPTVEGMTMTAVEPTDIENSLTGPEIIISAYLTPEKDGIYYVGVHGISPADKSALWVGDIRISEAMSAYLPGAVTGLEVTPDPNGELKGLLSFSAPTVTMGGHPLDEITSIEVRNSHDAVVHTFDNPLPGAELDCTVTEEKNGDYSYSVICYNGRGAGITATISSHIGLDKPAVPTGFVMTAASDTGVVDLVWDVVDTDRNGNHINPDLVSYSVYRIRSGEQQEIESGLKDTSYSFRAVEAGQQEFVQCAVFAHTESGAGSGAISKMLPVGTPYSGIHESFANKRLTYIWGVTEGGGSWSLFSDSSNFSSQDNDNGFIGMSAVSAGDNAGLISGMISLENMDNLGLQFYTFNMMGEAGTPDENILRVKVREGEGEYEEILSGTIQELCGSKSGWNKITVGLSAYKGKVIQMMLEAEAINFAYVLIDNLKVGSIIDHDLGVAAISAPATVETGKKFKVTVSVLNDGLVAANDYTVELYANDQPAGVVSGVEIKPEECVDFDFECELSPVATATMTYYALIKYNLDGNTANDMSEVVTVDPRRPKLPVADGLSANCLDNAVVLNWEAPDYEATRGKPVTEDFEDADSFSSGYGDWIFVDVDNSPVGGFEQTNIPGIVPGTTKGSFWIWDCQMIGNRWFDAYSGTKYLFALYRSDEQQTDDWAISPELDGSAQTVSFYAKSYDGDYSEYIEVWYSTGSTDVEDFVKVEGAGGSVAEQWTLYEAKLPEGARRFAIRSCAVNSFMLMVDDVTFIPEIRTDYELKGYNVYRDGVRLNDTPLTVTAYTDKDVTEGISYDYFVTAVYSEGQSAGSNIVTVLYTGGGSVGDIMTEGVEIRLNSGRIEIYNPAAHDILVTDIKGVIIQDVSGKEYADIHVAPGVYIVKTGGVARTVIVK